MHVQLQLWTPDSLQLRQKCQSTQISGIKSTLSHASFYPQYSLIFRERKYGT